MGYGMRWASNNSMQLTALRAAADAERWHMIMIKNEGDIE